MTSLGNRRIRKWSRSVVNLIMPALWLYEGILWLEVRGQRFPRRELPRCAIMNWRWCLDRGGCFPGHRSGSLCLRD